MSTDRVLGPGGGVYEIAPSPLAKEIAPDALIAKYELLSVEQLLDRKSPPWVVRRVIRHGEFVVVFGDPGCGKTFFVIDLSMCVVTGREWRGRKTRKGRILYFAGEGVIGLGHRILAWGIDGQIDARSLDAVVLPHAIAFLDDAQFEKLLRTIRDLDPMPVVIVVDTLARYLIGGDENSAKEMGLFVERCTRLQQLTGATVIVIHHSRKDSRVERGSSALRGAADVVIHVAKSGRLITVRGDKAKDAEPLPDMHFELKQVHLGFDEDDEPVTSCVLVDTEAPDKEESAAKVEEQSAPVATIEELGVAVRETLREVFSGQASGAALRDACADQVSRSRFYEVLRAEIVAGRVKIRGKDRYPVYVLRESGSPSPSPDSPLDSDSALLESGVRESESAAPP